MDLNGRTVIVTGSGSGIGRALALEFASQGSRVVCCGRRQERLDETVKLIGDKGGVALAVSADITDPAQVERLTATALREFGTIDALFNNAGSFQVIAGVHEVDPEAWWNDVKINLYGSLLTIRQVLPHMLKRNEGIIINMDGGRPVGGSAYASGKAGLMELTKVLAQELKMMESSVMVFAAGPGLVRTEMTELQANTPEGRKWIPSTKESFDAGTLRQPEDIARATTELFRVATPEKSGKNYNPSTDFSAF